MLVRRSTIAARAFFQIESPCFLNCMVALLFPFGSPEKEPLTLIASKVEDSVKDPGVVDAKAEPEKRGRSTRELPSTVSHDVCLIFFDPPRVDLVEGQSPGRFPWSVGDRPGASHYAHSASPLQCRCQTCAWTWVSE